MRELLCSALPATDTHAVVQLLETLFPEQTITPVASVLETLLVDFNTLTHPAGVLLNVGPIEKTSGQYYLFRDGISESTGKILQSIDDERMAIAHALDFETDSLASYIRRAGFNPKGKDNEVLSLEEALSQSEKLSQIVGPDSMRHRYITEDVPYGLVTNASLGRHLGVTTPITDSLIHLASTINGVDYWKQGRTVDNLGINHLDMANLKTFLLQGLPS
jgi:opine dehydrogenase